MVHLLKVGTEVKATVPRAARPQMEVMARLIIRNSKHHHSIRRLLNREVMMTDREAEEEITPTCHRHLDSRLPVRFEDGLTMDEIDRLKAYRLLTSTPIGL